jgi:hypothetical protein
VCMGGLSVCECVCVSGWLGAACGACACVDVGAARLEQAAWGAGGLPPLCVRAALGDWRGRNQGTQNQHCGRASGPRALPPPPIPKSPSTRVVSSDFPANKAGAGAKYVPPIPDAMRDDSPEPPQQLPQQQLPSRPQSGGPLQREPSGGDANGGASGGGAAGEEVRRGRTAAAAPVLVGCAFCFVSLCVWVRASVRVSVCARAP